MALMDSSPCSLSKVESKFEQLVKNVFLVRKLYTVKFMLFIATIEEI